MITQAFTHAARLRAQALGLTEHPVVVIDHPIASKNASQIQTEARRRVLEIAGGLASSIKDNNGKDNNG